MKLGGNPEKCMIYMIMQFLFEDDDAKLQDRYIRCRGGLLCGTCKKEVLDKVLSFVKAHNEKKGAFRPIAEKLLTQK
jgi:tryptophanyl-tRNA synthetase